jgi:hypothetical protein
MKLSRLHSPVEDLSTANMPDAVSFYIDIFGFQGFQESTALAVNRKKN